MADSFQESMLPIAIIDNIVVSKKEAWAWFRIPTDPFEFLSMEQKVQWGLSQSGAFASLMGDKTEPLPMKFVSTLAPVNIDAWEAQMRSLAEDRKTAIGFDDFLQRQVNYLRTQEYMSRVSYLGISLGKRGALNLNQLNPLEMGLRGAIDFIKEWGTKVLQTHDSSIDAFEENNLRIKETDVYRTLSTGTMKAVRCSAEEIVLNLIKRPFYPAMPTPGLLSDLENRVGPGDILYESTSVIEKHHRYLKMTQLMDGQELSGYRMTLVYEKFPSRMVFPHAYPFLGFPLKLGAPFTVYGHATLVPTTKMKKEVEKKRKEAKDEIQNMATSGSYSDSMVGSDVGADVSNSLQDLNAITEILASDNTPWIFGNYRVVLEASNVDTLNDYASFLMQAYGDMGIKLRVAAGSQLRLLQEQMPATPTLVKPFQQTTSLSLLSTSGWNISEAVGDKVYGQI